MPTPLDPRKKPTSIKIHVSSGTGVDVTWADGHAREKKASLGEAAPAFLSSPALPIFKPKPRAQAATQVGSYAIQISFTDGHSTGIYSYDHLRNLCPCAHCAKAFRASAG